MKKALLLLVFLLAGCMEARNEVIVNGIQLVSRGENPRTLLLLVDSNTFVVLADNTDPAPLYPRFLPVLYAKSSERGGRTIFTVCQKGVCYTNDGNYETVRQISREEAMDQLKSGYYFWFREGGDENTLVNVDRNGSIVYWGKKADRERDAWILTNLVFPDAPQVMERISKVWERIEEGVGGSSLSIS